MVYWNLFTNCLVLILIINYNHIPEGGGPCSHGGGTIGGCDDCCQSGIGMVVGLKPVATEIQ